MLATKMMVTGWVSGVQVDWQQGGTRSPRPDRETHAHTHTQRERETLGTNKKIRGGGKQQETQGMRESHSLTMTQ